MFHKNVAPQRKSNLPVAQPSTHTLNSSGLSLVSEHAASRRAVSLEQAAPHSAPARTSSLLELAFIVSRRCSSFFAEAAVLVLVFGILDYFMLKGRIELPWILGALAISAGLLAASVGMDFGAQRWIGTARGLTGAHP
jgi:hypothetical protein